MGILGDDDDEVGAIALMNVRKVARAVEAMAAEQGKFKDDVLSHIASTDKAIERIRGQLETLIAGQSKVSVGIQSDNIKNIGVAEGGSKVEQANG